MLAPQQYSQRLGVIAPEQFQAALDRFGLGRLRRAEAAPGGLFGQNVFLTTTEGEYVLRGCPHYSGQLPKEQFVARLIHERSAMTAPWPYLLDQSTDLFGWTYAIMPRLPGLQIGDADVRRSLSAEDKLAIACALGEGLAQLHQVTWPHCAEFHPATAAIKQVGRPFPDWVLEKLDDLVLRARRASNATTEEDVIWCHELVGAHRQALEVPFQPVLVHHDFKEGNSVAQRDPSGRWRLSGVFDLMEGYFGDPEEDLPRSVLDYESRDHERCLAFVRAYADNTRLRPGHRERFVIYMLRDCLLLWEYGQRNGGWFQEGLTFRSWAGPFVSLEPFPAG